jgi:hypothetical protein
MLPRWAGDEVRATLQKLGVGVGCVIAHSHYPISFLNDYAEELQRSAKSLAYGSRQDDGSIRSAVDFAVLSTSSPLSSSITAWRREHAILKYANEVLRLTRRPLSLEAFRSFLHEAQLLLKETRVPRSQLHQVAMGVRQGRLRSLNHFRYQVARSRPDASWRRFLAEAFADDFAAHVDEWLWHLETSTGAAATYSTSILDVLEVDGFLEA